MFAAPLEPLPGCNIAAALQRRPSGHGTIDGIFCAFCNRRVGGLIFRRFRRRPEAQKLRRAFRGCPICGFSNARARCCDKWQTLRRARSAFDDCRRHSDGHLCVGDDATDHASKVARYGGEHDGTRDLVRVRAGNLGSDAAMNQRHATRVSAPKPHFNLGTLKRTRWYELAARFAFGGAITVVAGLLAKAYGPAFGGLFLAFPAIFPATATLIEKHEKERKEKRGMSGAMRGREAAALCARGTEIGSLGLISFGMLVWLLAPRLNFALTLLIALCSWLGVAYAAWYMQRRHICSHRMRS